MFRSLLQFPSRMGSSSGVVERRVGNSGDAPHNHRNGDAGQKDREHEAPKGASAVKNCANQTAESIGKVKRRRRRGPVLPRARIPKRPFRLSNGLYFFSGEFEILCSSEGRSASRHLPGRAVSCAMQETPPFGRLEASPSVVSVSEGTSTMLSRGCVSNPF